MSTKAERSAMTDLALQAWDDVVTILAERGEVWPYTDCLRWGPGLSGAMERARTLTQACAVIGADEASDIGRLDELHQRTRQG